MKNSNILVTGGAGYIGSAITKRFSDSGYDIVVFDDLSSGIENKVVDGAKFYKGDIAKIDELEKVFVENSFDAVIHCAGKKSVRESEENPEKYFYTNTVGTLNVLSCMNKYQVPSIIFSSTAAVYNPQFSSMPFTEETSLAPSSAYGESKLLSEKLIRSFARTGKIENYYILRYFNVAGDCGLKYLEENAENVFPLIAKALKNESDFYIFGTDYDTKDGTGVRDYIHLQDLVTAHKQALTSSSSGVFNLGTKNGYSVRNLVSTFENLSGKKLKVKEKDRRAGDVGTVLADASKANTELDWEAEMSLDDMVHSTLKTYGII